MLRNGVTYTRDGVAASSLKEDLDACNSSVHQRLYESLSQEPWVVHWAACTPGSKRFDGKILDGDLIPEGSFFQSCPDKKTSMTTRMYKWKPGDPEAERREPGEQRMIRNLWHGEIVGPTIGPAEVTGNCPGSAAL